MANLEFVKRRRYFIKKNRFFSLITIVIALAIAFVSSSSIVMANDTYTHDKEAEIADTIMDMVYKAEEQAKRQAIVLESIKTEQDRTIESVQDSAIQTATVPDALCPPHELINGRHEYYWENNSSTHYYQLITTRFCMYCDYRIETGNSTTTQSHSLKLTDKHSGTTHTYGHSCSTCSYSTVITYPCPGNPCIKPYSIPIDAE